MSNTSIVAPNGQSLLQLARETEALPWNSQRSYRADWKSFETWCADHGAISRPATSAAVHDYLRDEFEEGRALATVRHRAATISLAHRVANLPDPCKQESIRQLLKALDRRDTMERQAQGKEKQEQAEGLRQREADRVTDKVLGDVQSGDAGIKEIRDLAALLTARDTLARASELVALTVKSVGTSESGGTTIDIVRLKTGGETQTIQLGSDAAAALRMWLDMSLITEGPLFRSITKGGKVKSKGIGVRDVGRTVKKLAGEKYSGHSLRVGAAQDLAIDNFEMPAIMQAGNWSTPQMVARYIKRIVAGKGAMAQYHSRRTR